MRDRPDFRAAANFRPLRRRRRSIRQRPAPCVCEDLGIRAGAAALSVVRLRQRCPLGHRQEKLLAGVTRSNRSAARTNHRRRRLLTLREAPATLPLALAFFEPASSSSFSFCSWASSCRRGHRGHRGHARSQSGHTEVTQRPDQEHRAQLGSSIGDGQVADTNLYFVTRVTNCEEISDAA